MDKIFKRAFDNSTHRCLHCKMTFHKNFKDYFTFYGNLNVADEGGLIGNCFDLTGVLKTAYYLCFDCTISYFNEQMLSVKETRKNDIKIGTRVLCWDSRVWTKRGKDLNHNEDCWKEAFICDIRYNVPCCEGTDNEHVHDVLIDVRFTTDNFESKGHFPSSIKKF